MSRSIFDVVLQSLGIIKENPIIILPALVVYLITTVVAILVLLFSGLYSMLGLNAGTYLRHPISLSSFSLHELLPLLVIGGVAVIVIGLVQLLLGGAYISIGKHYYTRKKISLRNAFKEAESKYSSMLGAGIILLAAVLLFGLVAGGVFYFIFMALKTSFSLALILLLFVFAAVSVVVAITLAILFFQTTTVIIVEGRGPIPAIRRSIEIGRSNIFPILLLYLLIAVMYLILGLFALIPIVGAIIQFAAGIILGIVSILVQPGFYFNYISRKSSRSI